MGSIDGNVHGPKLGGNDRVHKRIPNEVLAFNRLDGD